MGGKHFLMITELRPFSLSHHDKSVGMFLGCFKSNIFNKISQFESIIMLLFFFILCIYTIYLVITNLWGNSNF